MVKFRIRFNMLVRRWKEPTPFSSLNVSSFGKEEIEEESCIIRDFHYSLFFFFFFLAPDLDKCHTRTADSLCFFDSEQLRRGSGDSVAARFYGGRGFEGGGIVWGRGIGKNVVRGKRQGRPVAGLGHR